MIIITADKNSSISVNSFTGFVLTRTDWQEWAKLQGEKLSENESMEIIFKSKTEVEVKTYVDNISNSQTLYWQDFTSGTKQEKSEAWQKQWAELDKTIIDFTASK